MEPEDALMRALADEMGGTTKRVIQLSVRLTVVLFTIREGVKFPLEEIQRKIPEIETLAIDRFVDMDLMKHTKNIHHAEVAAKIATQTAIEFCMEVKAKKQKS